MKVRFVKNRAFEREIKAEPQARTFFTLVTRAVAVATREAAPVHTGDYLHTIRARGPYVFTVDRFGHLVEFGSVNNPPYAPLRRGVRSVGLRLDDSRK